MKKLLFCCLSIVFLVFGMEKTSFDECCRYQHRFQGNLNKKPCEAFIHYRCTKKSEPYMELDLYEYEGNYRIKSSLDLPGTLLLAAFTPKGLMVFGDTSDNKTSDDKLVMTLYTITESEKFTKTSFIVDRDYYTHYSMQLSNSGKFLAGFSQSEKKVQILDCETSKSRKYGLKYPGYTSIISIKFSDDSKKLFVLEKKQGSFFYRVICIHFLLEKDLIYKDREQKDFTLEDLDESFFK